MYCRDEAQPLTDACVMCPLGKFSLVEASFEEGKSFLWSLTAAGAAALCSDCPEGFQCNGGNSLLIADLEVFSR